MSFRTARVRGIVLSLVAVLVMSACKASPPANESETSSGESPKHYVRTEIRSVLAQDDDLGRARNHAPETDTLANAIRAYIAALDAIDFSNCPEDFTSAFRRHRDAWHHAIPFFERYNDQRGELHVLFDRIRDSGDGPRAELEAHEKAIWDTWAEVEAAAHKHDALPEDNPP